MNWEDNVEYVQKESQVQKETAGSHSLKKANLLEGERKLEAGVSGSTGGMGRQLSNKAVR